MQGYVKIHRKLLENPIAGKANYAWLWVTLLMLANHKETSFIWNDKKETLRAGQLLTGRKQLAKKTRISESKVYRILKYLENEQQIEQQKTTKFTIITIVNWNKYQQREQQSEQQVNNKRTTSEQQVNTYKNDKNDKNEKNDKNKSICTLLQFKKQKKEVLLKTKEKYPGKNCEKAYEDFVEYCEINKTKYKRFDLAFYKWVREDRFKQYKRFTTAPTMSDDELNARILSINNKR